MEKTLDKILSLMPGGGLDFGLLSLTAINVTAPENLPQSMPKSPIRSVIDDLSAIDEGLSFSRITQKHQPIETTSVAVQVQLDNPPEKDKLLQELRLVELQRQKLEFQNLLEEHRIRVNQHQQQEENLKNMKLYYEKAYRQLEQKRQRQQQQQDTRNQRLQLECLKEQMEHELDCLQREKSIFEKEKKEWDLRIQEFIEQTRKDEEEMKNIRNQLIKHETNRAEIALLKQQLEQQRQKVRRYEEELTDKFKNIEQKTKYLMEEKQTLDKYREQLVQQRHDLELSRLDLKSQTQNLRQIMKTRETFTRKEEKHLRSNSTNCYPMLEMHKKRSDTLQNVIQGLSRLIHLQGNRNLKLKKQAFNYLLSDRKTQILSATLNLDLGGCRSPTLKKSLILKKKDRSTIVVQNQNHVMNSLPSENDTSRQTTTRTIQLKKIRSPLTDKIDSESNRNTLPELPPSITQRLSNYQENHFIDKQNQQTSSTLFNLTRHHKYQENRPLKGEVDRPLFSKSRSFTVTSLQKSFKIDLNQHII